MEASFNTWTTIFLLAALHGLVLSGLVWRRNGTRSSRFMALFLLLFSITLATYVAYWTGFQRVYPHLMAVAEPLYFLFGPVFFAYIFTTLYPEAVISRKHLAHLLPFALYLAWMAPFFLLSAPEKLTFLRTLASEWGSLERLLPVGAKVLHLSAYLGASLWLIRRRFRGVRIHEVADYSKLRLRLLVTAACFGGFIGCYTLYYVLVHTIDFNVEFDYMISGAMTLFIYTVGYLGYLNGPTGEELRIVRKYETSTMDRRELDEQLERLQSHMRREKPWKDGELRLADPSNRDLTILHIAFESGFNNKTSFNKVFKENAGKTPSQFKKDRLYGNSA